MRTGKPIVYTSADSVFQVAAHEEVIPLWELYKICETAREMLRGPLEVGRVIARPFTGEPGSFTRTPNRQDYAVPPPRGMLLDQLQDHKVDVFSIGKIFDVFLGRGIGEYEKTKNNTDGMAKTLAALDEFDAGLIFVNLVDFDQLYGHRNDVEGYAKALEEFDAWLPSLYQKLSARDLADHHGRPRLRSDHALHRSQPRVCSAAGLPAAQAGSGRSGTALHAFRHRPNRSRKLRRKNRRRHQLSAARYPESTPMRRPIMAGNWKMYKTPSETAAFFEKFRPLVADSTHAEIVICPPFVEYSGRRRSGPGHAHPDRRAKSVLGQGRRLHRRSLRGHAAR